MKSVTITVASGSNTIDVYGKNTAYTSADNLYNANNQGTKLGSVTSTGTITVTGDYSYVGIRSYNGAIYLSKVEIEWESSSGEATTVTINDDGITNTDVYASTEAGSLTASVTAAGSAVSGATVSWSGNNDAVATIASDGTVTLVAAGSVTFTANYAGVSGTYASSSATYQMTVTSSAPYVQPTEIEITPNYTFWGKTGQFSGSNYDELSGSQDNVSLEWSRGNGSTYANSTAMRFYKDNELTFTAPTGYEIKSIKLTVSGTYSDLTFSPTGYDNTTTTWTGSSETVTMSRPSDASSYATISKFTITIGQASSDPSITINPATANHAASDEEGTLAISYENLTITQMGDFDVQFCDSEGNELASGSDPDWIVVDVAEQDPSIGDGYVVSYAMDANVGEARTAYFKIFALGDQDVVYSNLVTVTQAAYVAPFQSTTWTLANSITSGKHYIIVNQEASMAMGYDKGNNRAAVSVTIENETVTVNSEDVYEFVIYGPDVDNYYTIYDERTPGYLYAQGGTSNNYLKTSTEIADHSHWTITFDSDKKASIVANVSGRNTMKYNSSNSIFSCYASGQSDVYLYEKNGEATPTESITITDAKYATYSSENALNFNGTGAKVYKATTTANSMSVTFAEISDGIVPARTGFIVFNESATTLEVPTSATKGTGVWSDNDMVATLIRTQVNKTSGSGDDIKYNYIMQKSGDKVVFNMANGGYMPANRAYLSTTVDASASGARMNVVFDDDATTGISTKHNSEFIMHNEVYNLNGQRVNNPAKGMYIVNGKKVIK